MTLAGKFTDVLPDGQGTHLGGHVHVDSISTHAPPGAIIVPDAHLLFTGDFKRSGVDLILTGDDRELVLHDYFKGEKRAALASTDGAHLTGDIVTALTGHTQFAQADGTPSVAQVIGQVTKLVGTATAIRNGVSIILNQGDNVNKGDVVQSGSDSSLGITFIDGSVFGLASNAKMVLNEMIYDPNGSSNSSLISLVQGTISFVAGQTAKRGDMKVDTPVATMGIRGTAVLVEIDFVVQGQGGAPPAKFQVLVEPDGTTGSYILFDKTTLTPIATVNQAGTQTIVNGQGTVNFLSSVQLSPDAQKIISDVFALKFTDLTNPKSNTNFTNTVVPETVFVKLANGETVPVTVKVAQIADNTGPSGSGGTQKGQDHIPGPPDVVTTNATFTERTGLTGSSTSDTLTGQIRYADINPGDTPTAQATFNTFKYENAQHSDVTALLTAEQISAIQAVEVPLVVVQDPDNKNTGVATWTYTIPDGAFDFLADGETLTLTYLARVDNNFALNNETTFKTFTITITGTNDAPTVATSGGTVTERIGTGNTAVDTISGTVTFTDADLTDRPVVSAALSTTEPFRYLDAQGHNVTAGLTAAQLAAIAAVEVPLSVVQGAGNSHNGSATWTYSIADHAFDFIAKGETLILNYVIQVSDGHGGVVATPVSISINGADVSVVGTNDVPTIATTDGAFAELTNPAQPNPTGSPTPDTASGTINFTDVDLSDRPVVSAAYTSYTYYSASHNPLSLTPDQLADVAVTLGVTQTSGNTNNGSASWTYNVADGKFDFLAVGEILTLTYTATVDDGHGGVITKPFTIAITGSNDTATIATTDAVFAELTNPAQPNPTGSPTPDTASGTISFADVDLSDRPVVSTAYTSYTYYSASHNPLSLTPDQLADVAVALGVTQTSGNTNTGSAIWTYNVADGKFDFLAVDEVLTLTYTATVDDGHGGVITKPFTIAITGSNDTATVATTNAVFAELTNPAQPNPTGSPTPDTASGTISFADVDLSDRPVVSAAYTSYTYFSASHNPLSLTPDQLADVAVALGLAQSGNTNTGSANWTYNVADGKFDFLAVDEVLTLTYTATVNDGHGGVITKPFTIAITGTNDTATVATTNGAFQEMPGTGNATLDHAGGTISFADADLSDRPVVTASFSDYTYKASDGTTDLTLSPQQAIDLEAILSLTPDSGNINTGSVTWSYDVADNKFDFLAYGEILTLSYTATVSDSHGGVITKPITVTITGANDAPTVAAVDAGLTDTAINDSFVPIAGTLVGYDADHGETATLVYAAMDGLNAVNSAVAGLYGSLTVDDHGNYNYVADASAINALHAGSYFDIFTVQTTDVHGVSATATFKVNVTGANDAPTVAAVNAGLADTAINDSFAPITGTLAGSDLDSGETGTLVYATMDGLNAVNSAVTGLYGSLTVDDHGHYSYVADASAINALGAGSYLDTFTVQTTDVNGVSGTATFNVNVTGTNDAPTLAGVNAGTLIDTAIDDSFSTITGTLVGNDLDSGETGTLVYATIDGPNAVNSAVVGTYGSLTVDAQGNYSYVPDAAAVNALGAGAYTDTFTVQTTDASGASGTATFKVNVTGTNDAPVISIEQLLATDNGDGTTTLFGLSVTDPDTATLTLAATTAGHGSGTSVAPATDSGTLAHINASLQSGITYSEGATPTSTDMVTLTVADASGATDTINFIFNVAAVPATPVTLAGTTGKDVFFGTGYEDTFVFAANSNHDTIMNFTHGVDHIDLSAMVSGDETAWFNQHVTISSANAQDALIKVDADTIVLRGVDALNLSSSDFILHVA